MRYLALGKSHLCHLRFLAKSTAHFYNACMQGMRRNRVYVDTSVLGAVFDEEFREATATFFQQARLGRFDIVLSALVEDEISLSPQNVQDFYAEVLEYAEAIFPTQQAILLQQAYLDAGVVSPR